MVGWSRNSNSVTTPKLPPPPRRPQKRSGFSVAVARTVSPSAVTTVYDSTLSQASPNWRASQPMPPPSVSPPTPVCETLPAVVARPCGRVERSRVRRSAPPWTVARRRSGSTADLAHRRQVDHQAALGHGQPQDAVPAALDRDLETRIASMADRRRDVVRRRAASDERRPPIDHRVPDLAMVVVGRVAGLDDLAGEAADGRVVRHRVPPLTRASCRRYPRFVDASWARAADRGSRSAALDRAGRVPR